MKMIWLIALSLTFGTGIFWSGQSWADSKITGLSPIIENLVGEAGSTLHTEDGKTEPAQEGGEVPFGSVLTCGPDSEIRVVFEQGTQLLLSANSRARIFEEKEENGGSSIAAVELEEGEARFLVTPETPNSNSTLPPPSVSSAAASNPPEPSSGTPSSGPSSLYRFFVHTRNVVMGVRGTDFVVSSSQEGSEIHTLSGVVDTATDFKSVTQGKGQPVSEGQFTRATPKKIEAPKAFSKDAFLIQFHRKHPRLATLWQTADRDSKSGKLREKFRKIRSRPGGTGRSQ